MSRRAFTVVEVMVSMVLLAAALGAIAFVAGATRTGIRHDRAWVTVARALDASMETLTAGGYDQLPPRQGEPVPLAPEWTRQTKGLKITATVVQSGPYLRTVILVASWPNLGTTDAEFKRAELRTQVAARTAEGGVP